MLLQLDKFYELNNWIVSGYSCQTLNSLKW
jgi:hypothetical protein